MSQVPALLHARPQVLWTDREDAPAPLDPLPAGTSADLVVVGSGFTGLWAALRARVEHPDLDVVLIDRSEAVGSQASTRNGGFLSASLTHGLENAVDRFPREVDELQGAGRANFDGLVADLEHHGIDAGLELVGQLTVADRAWQVDAVRAAADLLRQHGQQVEVLERDEVQREVASPTYHLGLWEREGEALVDPARLVWGLADAVKELGVRLHRASLDGIERRGAGLELRTDVGALRCGATILGTGAFTSPVRAVNRRVVPVYDHVLATEPLDAERRASIGWQRRQGISDAANQFHYYRLTEDDRIVWGGYDAVFHNWGRIDESLEQRDATHEKLARHFAETFPQLADVRFTHRWGGVIDTSTRFSVGFGTAFDGRVAYAVGYTGLGVGASRFGGQVCVDLLYRPESELLELEMVRKRLLPFPPEPVRTAGIQLTRRAIARADEAQGRRGGWLRLLDRLGLGFDS